MAGRSRFAPNCVDTEQIYDECITQDKIDPAMIVDMNAALATYSGIIADTTITHDGGAKQKIGDTLLYGTLITACIVEITEAWNGSGAGFNIGHDGSSQFEYFMPAAAFNASKGTIIGNDPSVMGIGLWAAGAQNGTTPFAVTAYAHPIVTYVDSSFDAVTYAYVTQGTHAPPITGEARVLLFGVKPIAGGSL